MSTPTAQRISANTPVKDGDETGKRWIARQPIFDRHQATYGYELLFRGPWRPAEDGSRATAHVINEMVNVIGLRHLLDGKIGFVNITRQMLLNGDYQLLPQKSVVIELLEDVPADPDVLDACRRLKERGYRLALDDFIEVDEANRRLVALADIVKIDFMGTTAKQRWAIVNELSRPGLTWLAEKVETHREFDEAMKLNCKCVQGFFFCMPQQVHGSEIPANKQNYLRLVHAVNDMDFDFDRVEKIVRQELSLSVKLLNYLNSAHVGLSQRVESIHQALALLGERPLRKWAALAATTCLGDDKPAELLRTTMVRARFCEQIGEVEGVSVGDVDLFLMGLLSTTDAFLDRSLDELLLDMPIGVGLKVALLGGDTVASKVNRLARACERGDEDAITDLAGSLNIAEATVIETWHEATVWAGDIM